MTDIERAVAYFNDGYSCSQAILATYGPPLGIDRETAFRIAAGFSGGMRIGETCGAVTGAIMVLGLKHASPNPQAQPARENTYESVKELIKRFTARNGTVTCKELLDCDISTPEGIEAAENKDLFRSVCPRMVEDAARMLEEILNRPDRR